MSNKKIFSILFLVITAVTIFEIFNLTAISLWHDESFSALLIKYDFGEMIERIKMDVHPPLYYILLKSWDFLFGNSLFSLRLFSVLFSVLAIISVYFFVNQGFRNRKLALFSSLLFALCAFQIQYAMEARMYALGTFLVVISGYFFLKALEKESWKWWLFYALAISAGIYTHYFVVFWFFAHLIYFFLQIYKKLKLNISLWLKSKNFQLGIGAYVLIAISYIPWLGTFLKQAGQVQESYWIPEISVWSIPNTFLKMTTGIMVDPARSWYVLVILMVVVTALIFFFLKKNQTREKWLIFLLLILPFLITVFLSFKRPIYIDRYFIFGFPFYLIFVAGGILLIKKRQLRYAIIAAALLGSLVSFPIHWQGLDVEKKPGMAGAANYLNQEVRPNEKIFVGSSLIYFTFKYYNQTNIYPRLYAPGDMPHFAGTALLSPEDIIVDFNKETNPDDIVWMINTTGFGNYQPAVPENWIKEEEKGFQDAYEHLGWIVVTKYRVQ